MSSYNPGIIAQIALILNSMKKVFGPKFESIKSLIGLAKVRLETVRKKALQELAHRKRLLAKNLQDDEIAQARLEAERIVKLDWKVEALGLLEIKFDEVRDNVPLLKQSTTIPGLDLDEAVSTIIYSNGRVAIPEIAQVVKVLKKKYGKDYIELNENNGAKRVNQTFIHRLSGQRPNAYLVMQYMKEIAVSFNIPWVPDEGTKQLGERFDAPMSAGGPGLGSASGMGTAAYAVTDGRILPRGMKPKGFVPPTTDGLEELVAKHKAEKEDQSGDDNDDSGGDLAVSNADDSQPKPVQDSPPPKPISPPVVAPKKAGAKDSFADLEARFAKLKQMS